VLRVRAISLDPYVGQTLKGRHMGHDAGGVGAVVIGAGVGEVVESRAEGFAPGDLVAAETGWRTHAVVAASAARRVPVGVDPLSLHVGVLGMPGLTAWAGMTDRAKVREGERVLVSSAARPVGGTAGQIARLHGAARVVGLAGGAEKCALVRGRYGFDDCIDYKQEGWQERIAKAFPDGITVYWDNVGGELLDVALANLAEYGRVVLCGLASQYHADERPAGPNPGTYIAKRAELYGMVVYDYYGRQAEYAELAAAWVREGKLAYAEDVAEGLDAAPALFERLMAGRNVGKAVVRL
jgi:NADPH-dependent curcumin reductase CurA